MKMIRSALLVLFAGVLALWGQAAQTVEVLKVPSRIMAEERTLLVSLPAAYAAGQERYPVLYLTDGDAHIAHTRATVDFLARNGLIPNLILVGVTNTDRTRDLTPTRGTFRREDGTEQAIPSSGGAPRFLEFIEKEVFPLVEGNYRTLPYRIFAGHSLGGLLALHILAVRPELFQGIIAASPSLNWDQDYPLRKLEESLKGRKEFQRTLFVTMANEEDRNPRPNRFDRLQQILKSHKPGKFAGEARHMPGEDHGSVVLASHYWGLRKVFDGWRLGGLDGGFRGGLEELKAHYAKLGERLGFAVRPPEAAVNLAGYQALQREKAEEALAIFRFNLELYPASANVYDSLAEGLEKAGRREEALNHYRTAAELAVKAGDPRATIYTQNRDRLAAAVKGKP